MHKIFIKYICLFVSNTFLFLTGCTQSSSPETTLFNLTWGEGASEFVISTNVSIDYTEGNVGVVDIANRRSVYGLLPIGSDNFVKTYNGSIYICDRTDNSVMKVGGLSNLFYQNGIGTGVNIHDIAFVNDSLAYITQYNSTNLAVFNPMTGTVSSSPVNLSSYVAYAGTDSAGPAPHMDNAIYYNGFVYVTCQRLKAPEGGWIGPADTSLIVVINAITGVVNENSIKLAYKNPQGVSLIGDKLYVSCTGYYGMQDGGIECIDLVTNTNMGTIATETQIGGDITTIIVLSETKGYVIYGNWPASTVKEFNPATKKIGSDIICVEVAAGMTSDGTSLYVGDRSPTIPGIIQINPVDNSKIGNTFNVGIPPNRLAYLNLK